MTKVFKSAIGLKQKTKKAVDDTMPRYGTVAASNGQMVQLIMDGDTEPGGIYPSSVHPVAVGTRGVVQPVQGGAKIFTPLGMIVPNPTMNGSYPSVTLSTAGTYQHNASAVLTSGMIPGELYKALVTAQVIVFTTGTANTRFRFGYTVTDYERTNWWTGTDTLNAPFSSGDNQRLLQACTYSHSVRARDDGTILFTPAIQWVSGTPYWQWQYLTVTIF